MKRSMVVFVALGLLAGLVGCGGSGINAEGNQDKAFVVTEFIAGTEFDGTRAEAECVVDELIDFLDITYAEFRAALESGPDWLTFLGGEVQELTEDDFISFFIPVAIDCGVNPYE